MEKYGATQTVPIHPAWQADWTQVHQHDLPAALQEIAVVIGVEGALTLAQHVGGESFYIGLRSNQRLVAALGQKRAGQLSAVYHGDVIYIPKLDAALRHLRNREIYRQRQKGISLRQLVRYFGVSEGTIKAVLREVAGVMSGSVLQQSK